MCCYHAVVFFSSSNMNHTIDGFVVFLFAALAVREKETTFAALETVPKGMFVYHVTSLYTSLLESNEHVVRCHWAFHCGLWCDLTSWVVWIGIHGLRSSKANQFCSDLCVVQLLVYVVLRTMNQIFRKFALGIADTVTWCTTALIWAGVAMVWHMIV